MNFLKIAVVCVAMLLSGCDRINQMKEAEKEVAYLRTENSRLAQRNSALEESMSMYEQQRMRDERDALMAALCDDWIPICPASILEPGRALLKNGLRPSDPDIVYFFLAKRLLVIAGALLLMIASYLGWHLWFAKTLPKIWRAEASLEEALSKVEHAQKKVADFQAELERKKQEAHAELQTFDDEIESARLKLLEIKEQCRVAEKSRDTALDEARQAQAIKKALEVF